MKKVLFLIRSLNIGGAERQLLTVAKSLDRSRFEPVVVTFYDGGDLLPEFAHEEIPVMSAGKQSRWDLFTFIIRLIRIIRSQKPDVVFSYLVAANILVVILAPFFRPAKIVTSIRHSFISGDDYDRLANMLYALEDRISGWSDLIVVNSMTGARMAIKRGVPPSKIVTIPNGIDTKSFYPIPRKFPTAFQALNIPSNSTIIGIVARIDPVKDHHTFIKAAARVAQQYPQCCFLIIGSGDSLLEHALIAEASRETLGGRLFFIPNQKDMLSVYNSLDICVSSSIGEGFSNVIAEAMACEVPCVVTDVGDSAVIVGKTGLVVPAGDSQKLSDAILNFLDMQLNERKRLGRLARQRIISEYSVEKMVSTTMLELEKFG